MKIQPLESASGIEIAFPVLKLLRPHLVFQEYTALYEAARVADGYALVGGFEDPVLVAVMGYRILSDFVHGRHLYVDDLIVIPEKRSCGIGAALLEYAETKAFELGCSGLRLCTGIENEAGKRFYEREGWSARAVAFKKALS